MVSGVFAMQSDDVTEDSSTPRLRARAGNGWHTPVPRLRVKQEQNQAKVNNCGRILVKVSLHTPFAAGIDRIMKETKIKGEIVNKDDQYLTLFTFNVPITNELVARMPKNIRPRADMHNLSRKDKELLAEQIKNNTMTIVNCNREKKIFMFGVEQVTLENGIATAYFAPEDDMNGFVETMDETYKNLKCAYRWGDNDSDGIWFEQEQPKALRPLMVIIRPKRDLGKKLQVAVGSLAGRLSSRQSSGQTSQSSNDLLSRTSNDVKRPTLMASHRSSSASSMETTPTMSPEKSPRNSADEAEIRSFSRLHLEDIPSLDATGNRLRIETEIIETQSGNC